MRQLIMTGYPPLLQSSLASPPFFLAASRASARREAVVETCALAPDLLDELECGADSLWVGDKNFSGSCCEVQRTTG